MSLRDDIIRGIDKLFVRIVEDKNGDDLDYHWVDIIAGILKINLYDYDEFRSELSIDMILDTIRGIQKIKRFKYKIEKDNNVTRILIHKKVADWQLNFYEDTKEVISCWFGIHESYYHIYNLIMLKDDLLGWLTDVDFYLDKKR